jgi:exodeoxyribonuclease-3
MLSWNVNGIRAITRKGFPEWLMQQMPDILCVQEIKAAEEQFPPVTGEESGYHRYICSAEKKGYSGVALWSRDIPETVGCGFGFPEFDGEGRTLFADYGDFILFNVYFPNGKASAERLAYKMAFYRSFLRHVRSLRERGRRVIICGDVNTAHREIDLARAKENAGVSGFLPEERAWIDDLISLGFIDTFRMFNTEAGQYTWWDYKTRARDRNIGWRIDYFFVSSDLASRVRSASILSDTEGSDHCPVELVLEVT